MADPTTDDRTPVAIACQGGGMHASFAVGVLTRVLEELEKPDCRFKLVGLSGTSAGALVTLMAWYGLAKKDGQPGSPGEAKTLLNDFWNGFTAMTRSERALNAVASLTLAVEGQEILGVAPRRFGLNPGGILSEVVNAALPRFGVRRRYFDFGEMLNAACPLFEKVDWDAVTTRLMVGATEVRHGIETVFDSDKRRTPAPGDPEPRHTPPAYTNPWRTRLKLSVPGIIASGTLPTLRPSQVVGAGLYWDGLYSQNPPVREFVFNTLKDYVPAEIWIVRINPQECVRHPTSLAEIEDRQNELMGNLSLDKELDMILTVNEWIEKYRLTDDEKQHVSPGAARAKLRLLEQDFRHVDLRTIKMREATAAGLSYASKFDRSAGFVEQLRREGHEVADEWLSKWPDDVGYYPEDAAYRPPPASISGGWEQGGGND